MTLPSIDSFKPGLIQTQNLVTSKTLPPLDRILDLCKERKDFPQHLIQNNRKRRRSLVYEFLTDKENIPNKRKRAVSIDQKNGYQIFSWHQGFPKSKIDRRHSMFETGVMHTSSGMKKGMIRPWSVEEDNNLLSAVKQFGGDWTRVAKEIDGRNRRQCKEHWLRVLSKRPIAAEVTLNSLSPDSSGSEPRQESSSAEFDMRRGLWSGDEDLQLLKAFEELGPKWTAIAERVSGRNQRQCEKRFRRIKKAKEYEEKEGDKEQSKTSADIDTDAINGLYALAGVASAQLTQSVSCN
jgi:hypothetical protein